MNKFKQEVAFRKIEQLSICIKAHIQILKKTAIPLTEILDSRGKKIPGPIPLLNIHYFFKLLRYSKLTLRKQMFYLRHSE